VTKRLAGATAVWLAVAACAPRPGPRAPAAAPVDDVAAAKARVAELVASEGRALSWLAAADPRLAARLGTRAPDEVLSQIGTEAVLAEDASASIHDGTLDLFGFRARAVALGHAAREAASIPPDLPAVGAVDARGDEPARPLLERELLVRLVDEEAARDTEEGALGPASGDLVRAMLATWKAPSGDDAWRARDTWAARHLGEIADSLRGPSVHEGPFDLDQALYPLERLLAPLSFPKAAAAIAHLRTALDDVRGVPPLRSAASIGRGTRTHLGVSTDLAALGTRLVGVREHLRARALAILTDAGGGRGAIEAQARELLFVEGPCPAVIGSRVRAAAPPPERAPICGALKALTEPGTKSAAVIALHDDLSLAMAAFDPSPPPRTALLSRPDDEHVDSLRRSARERPVVAIGLALAALVLYDDPAATDGRTSTWAALGDAPLDVVARELGAPPLP
jgi:hypothetical protein